MNKKLLPLLISIFAMMLFPACASVGTFPHSTATSVNLAKSNYRIIKSNAIGESSGFSLLGFIPLVPPTYTDAMSDLYGKAGISEGKAQALVNVTQERSMLYLILFSIPKLTVRADVIEFLEEKP